MPQSGPRPPLAAVVQLGHAAVQQVADRAGVDVLHVKGYAIDPALRVEGRAGTDVDVIVRPEQVPTFLRALVAAGWEHVIGFRAGSPFGHAATLRHESWGYVDVHRLFPGITVDPAEAFELLWQGHRRRPVAGVPCTVPDLAVQTLVLVLNAARKPRVSGLSADVEASWCAADPELRARVEELVRQLGAEVAFAAGTGRLEEYRDRRDYLLWKVMSRGGTKFEEWRARILAAPTRREAVDLVFTAPLVNVEHLTVLWGRRPTRGEIVREFFARPIRGLAEQVGVSLSRRRSER